MAKQIIIKGTPVVAANEVLVADSNSKIPAVDGSLVTAMSGTNVGSGTIATARLDTGTAANKIVVLDGSAKIPAVDGSLLTGIVSYTKSASDPTISTNPSGGVGTEWVNTSTGKQFICTDATAGANVWSCSGSHSGDVNPVAYQGSSYGFVVGGAYQTTTPSDMIQRFAFASGGSSDYGSNLETPVRYTAGTHSGTHGYTVSGHTYPSAYINKIQKYAMASATNATDVANSAYTGEGMGGHSSETYGYTTGLYPPTADCIQKHQFATDGDGVDIGNLATTSYAPAASSDWGNGYGWYHHAAARPNGNIGRFSFSSDGNSTEIKDAFHTVGNTSSTSSLTHGYIAGGTSNTDVVQKYDFASASNGTDVGNLTVGRNNLGTPHPSSETHGYTCGASYSGVTWSNIIDRYSFSADGNSTDVGDLARGVYWPACSQI